MRFEHIRGSAVAVDEGALLILGGAGAGKSTLALDLIAFGAKLVSDDVVRLEARNDKLIASRPRTVEDRIEARGIGVLKTPAAQPTPLRLAIDLEALETERLPPIRKWTLLGVSVPLILRTEPLFPSAVLAALRAGGPEDPEAPPIVA